MDLSLISDKGTDYVKIETLLHIDVKPQKIGRKSIIKKGNSEEIRIE